MRIPSLVLVALAFCLAACGPAKPAATASPKRPFAGENCSDQLGGFRQVKFGIGAEKNLVGLVAGAGKTGIVLAHQNGGSVCQWTVIAKELAAKGYRALTFDFNGFGTSTMNREPVDKDVTAAAEFLRADGATSIVLIGASMGGTGALVAAASLNPPVTAVVSVSSPAIFGGRDALAIAPKLTMPVLYLCGEGDVSFADSAQQLYDASKASKDRQLKLVAGSTHGVGLIQPLGNGPALSILDSFLARHAPA